jgi:hypothetical protein
VLRASFTAGDLAYDVDARPFFTYRFLSEGETEEDVHAPWRVRKLPLAPRSSRRGLGYQLRSTQVQDLCQAPLTKRQRRTQG